jgi:hypothetical protein
VGRPVQQYWAKEAGPYRFLPAAEMAKAFQNSRIGQAAATELAQPPERTQQGNAGFCLQIAVLLKSCLTSKFRRMPSSRLHTLLACENATSAPANHS